jgi:hypothetical protein
VTDQKDVMQILKESIPISRDSHLNLLNKLLIGQDHFDGKNHKYWAAMLVELEESDNRNIINVSELTITDRELQSIIDGDNSVKKSFPLAKISMVALLHHIIARFSNSEKEQIISSLMIDIALSEAKSEILAELKKEKNES